MATYSREKLREVYWNSCKHEGYLNIYIYRRLSLPLAVAAGNMGLSPNGVTMVSFVLSIISAVMFGFGDMTLSLWALLPFHLGKILDCSDGQLASLANKRSALGGFLDPFLDRVTDVAVLAGLAVGYQVSTGSYLALYLLLALVSTWFIGAYLNAQSISKDGDTLATLRKATTSVPSTFQRLLKWDGGFTGLITTLAVVFAQVPALIVLNFLVGVMPLPIQFKNIYGKLKNLA